MTQAAPLDCLVIGAGPAGLVTSVYLARYRRTVRLIDAGASRVESIPRTRNVMGFPDGIAGAALLGRMRQHAAHYGVDVERGRVEALRKQGDGFVAAVAGEQIAARSVILCTGARDLEPQVAGLEAGLRGGQVRYCPVCDGFETQHQNVAVLGPGLHGLRESLFVAGFDNEVTWLAMGTGDAVAQTSLAERQRLSDARIRIVDAPVARLLCHPGQGIQVELGGGPTLAFDTLYAALGQTHRSELGVSVGAEVANDNGQLVVDAHLQTTVPGLYAAGDVANGLNQINVAAGHAAIAATAAHNRLCG